MFRTLGALTVPLLLAMTASPGHATSAQLLATRSGQTPRGATRVVFETDRAVEYLAVELPAASGFEIHLLDVDGTSVPMSLNPKGKLVRQVDFRGTANGVVAEILGANAPLQANTFTLPNPPRVVVDLTPASRTKSVHVPSPTRRIGAAGPVPARKVTTPATDAGSASSGTLTAESPPRNPNTTMFEETDASSIAAARRAIPENGDFEDLLVWIHALQSCVTALNTSDSETERALYRRRLGYLLIQRGLLVEGEKALLSAVQGEARDAVTVVTDSVAIAEVRRDRGEFESASEIARAVDTGRATPPERLRLASVLLDTGAPTLATNLVQATLEHLRGSDRARGTLLLARAQHQTGHTKAARDTVRPLTTAAATPASLLPDALLLHADCEFALGRLKQAETLYDRAVGLKLSDDDASWATLQLGNLARRNGHHDEARRRWQVTAETWPETFYASQATWFLRVADAVQKLNEAEADGGRG